MSKCIICGKKADRCHIRSRGAGGPNTDENIVLLCRLHHIESHRRGWNQFITKYPVVGKVLLEKGWDVEYIFERPRLTRLWPMKGK